MKTFLFLSALFLQSTSQATATASLAEPTASMAALWDREPTSFFSVKLGETVESSLPPCATRMLYGHPYAIEEPGRPECAFADQYGGYEVMNGPRPFFNIYVYKTGRVAGKVVAAFKDREAQTVAAALAERFGPAQETSIEEMHTKAGARYKSTVLKWRGKELDLIYRSIGTSVDEGSVSVTSHAYIAAEAAERKAAKEALKSVF